MPEPQFRRARPAKRRAKPSSVNSKTDSKMILLTESEAKRMEVVLPPGRGQQMMQPGGRHGMPLAEILQTRTNL